MAGEALPGAGARQSVMVARNLHASLSTLKDTAEQLQGLCVEHVDAGDALAECARQLNRSSLQCIQVLVGRMIITLIPCSMWPVSRSLGSNGDVVAEWHY